MTAPLVLSNHGNRKAIATLATGRHRDIWERYCKNDWLAYGQRHGIDIVLFEGPIDLSELGQRRPVAWQAMLVFEVLAASHDLTCWVDADVLINLETAPDVMKGRDPNKVTLADWGQLINSPLADSAWRRLAQAWGFDEPVPAPALPGMEAQIRPSRPMSELRHINGGVMASGAEGGQFLRQQVYERYDEPGPQKNYYQWPLALELTASDRLAWMDHRFNFVFSDYYMAFHRYGLKQGVAGDDQALHSLHLLNVLWNAFNASYFLHVAGGADRLAFFCENRHLLESSAVLAKPNLF
jgi:hypothetical protein